MRILLTGGGGRLGTELQKLRKYEWAPPSKRFNLMYQDQMEDYCPRADLIVHCAAYTNVAKAEVERFKCWETNVSGTRYLAALGIPILYISTEYVFDGEKGFYSEDSPANPTTFYGITKFVGESLIGDKGKILRLIFKPRPWPFNFAFTDQFTSGDYVDVMAKEVDKAITLFDKLPRITHLGTGRKSMYDLAIQSTNAVGNLRRDMDPVKLPADCSLDTSVWTRLKLENNLL